MMAESGKKLTGVYLIHENGKRLLQAARDGNSAEVIDLLGKGTPIACDWLGTSPLHVAVANNHFATCEVLLNAGVLKDGRTKVDRTPLHFAAYAGHAHIARLLLENGAEVDCRDMLQMTPLHWAVEKRHAECVKLLLSYGADAQVKNKFAKSPLLMAIESGWIEAVHLLAKPRSNDVQFVAPNEIPEVTMKNTETEFTFNAHRLDLDSDKTMDDLPEDTLDLEKDAQNSVEHLLPQVNVSPSEATVQLFNGHGIMLTPNDNTNTVNSAIQSGRKVVLSDAGKLVLKEVNLAKPPMKEIDDKKKPIVIPPSQIKHFYTLVNNQLVPVTNNNQISTKAAQKPMAVAESPKNLNYVKLPNDTLKFSSWNRNIKIVAAAPRKANVNMITLTKDNFTASSKSPIKQGKVIKLKGVNWSGGSFAKRDSPTTLPYVADSMNVDVCSTSKDIFPMDVITSSTDISEPTDATAILNSTESEICRLKSELEIAYATIEGYKKALEEKEAELAIYKCRNRDSFMGVETNSID